MIEGMRKSINENKLQQKKAISLMPCLLKKSHIGSQNFQNQHLNLIGFTETFRTLSKSLMVGCYLKFEVFEHVVNSQRKYIEKILKDKLL